MASITKKKIAGHIYFHSPSPHVSSCSTRGYPFIALVIIFTCTYEVSLSVTPFECRDLPPTFLPKTALS